MFVIKKIETRQKTTVQNPVCTHPLKLLLKPKTRSFKRNTIELNVVLQSKSLDKSTELRSAFQKKDLFLRLFYGHHESNFWMNYWRRRLIDVGRKTTSQTRICSIIVCIQTLVINSELIAYVFVGKMKVPLLHYFPFILKPKAGDILTTGQYMKYHTICNLHLRPLLKGFLL